MKFTSQYRINLHSELMEIAQNDLRISGAVITGSVAVGKEDRWWILTSSLELKKHCCNRL
jgi:hypothetical protein